MEATGGYGEELASHLLDHGHVVSIVNPMQIRAFGQSELSRTKTDKADAHLIARFCQKMTPPAWDAPSEGERRLRQLVRRRRALVEMRAQERTRSKGPGTENVRDSLLESISFLDEQIERLDQRIQDTINHDDDLRGKRNLIESIAGIGPTTSSTLLAETPHIKTFASHKALAAFAGVCPQERRSGTSVSSSRVTRIGNREIRRVLYMAALSALRCNPVIQAFADRLRTSGKRPMEINVAVMRKLVVLVYGVLKNGQPFDPQWGLDG
jgi:transposase